jgi:hypothetical protein
VEQGKKGDTPGPRGEYGRTPEGCQKPDEKKRAFTTGISGRRFRPAISSSVLRQREAASAYFIGVLFILSVFFILHSAFCIP